MEPTPLPLRTVLSQWSARSGYVEQAELMALASYGHPDCIPGGVFGTFGGTPLAAYCKRHCIPGGLRHDGEAYVLEMGGFELLVGHAFTVPDMAKSGAAEACVIALSVMDPEALARWCRYGNIDPAPCIDDEGPRIYGPVRHKSPALERVSRGLVAEDVDSWRWGVPDSEWLCRIEVAPDSAPCPAAGSHRVEAGRTPVVRPSGPREGEDSAAALLSIRQRAEQDVLPTFYKRRSAEGVRPGKELTWEYMRAILPALSRSDFLLVWCKADLGTGTADDWKKPGLRITEVKETMTRWIAEAQGQSPACGDDSLANS